jgi:hypothetical protein
VGGDALPGTVGPDAARLAARRDRQRVGRRSWPPDAAFARSTGSANTPSACRGRAWAIWTAIATAYRRRSPIVRSACECIVVVAVLVGGLGTGKTNLATAIGHRASPQARPVLLYRRTRQRSRTSLQGKPASLRRAALQLRKPHQTVPLHGYTLLRTGAAKLADFYKVDASKNLAKSSWF